MKKLLLVGAGLLSLCTVGLTTAKAGPDDYYRRGDDYGYRPRTEYRERYDDREDCYPRRRVVVREYYTPRYYTDDCRPRYYYPRRRSHVSISLPLPPLPFPPF